MDESTLRESKYNFSMQVNNAGINSGAKSFLHCSSEEIDTVIFHFCNKFFFLTSITSTTSGGFHKSPGDSQLHQGSYFPDAPHILPFKSPKFTPRFHQKRPYFHNGGCWFRGIPHPYLCCVGFMALPLFKPKWNKEMIALYFQVWKYKICFKAIVWVSSRRIEGPSPRSTHGLPWNGAHRPTFKVRKLPRNF